MVNGDGDDDNGGADKNVGPWLTGERGNKYKLGNVGCKCSIGTMGIKPHYHHCIARVCATQIHYQQKHNKYFKVKLINIQNKCSALA